MGKKKEHRTGAALHIEKFGLLPDYQLTKKEKLILKTVLREEVAGFLPLCRVLDVKPSKLEKMTVGLIAKGLLSYAADGTTYALTPAAMQLMTTKKEDRKMQKKFRAFLESLNQAESEEFCRLCDQFQNTEDADTVSAEADRTE